MSNSVRLVVIFILTACIFVWLGAGPPRSLSAAGPFVVNVTDDISDGVCDAAHCSLRDAIEAVNSSGELSRVEFNVPIDDPGYSATTETFLIRPTAPLPAITAPVTIDGYTQPGSVMNTGLLAIGPSTQLKIELNGTGVGTTTPGLVLTAGSSIVSGLVLTGFPEEAIRIDGGSGSIISGNFIGINPAGDKAAPNAIGVRIVESTGNTIGGSAAAATNLISGNSDSGIVIFGGGSHANRVIGNQIGTERFGLGKIGNGINGIAIFEAPNNQIGAPSARNVISGNRTGIQIVGTGSIGNIVQSNLIGVTGTGLSALGNFWAGVMIIGAPSNIIGGTGVDEGNVISGNQAEGISMFNPESIGNKIEGNLIGLSSDGSGAIGNFLQGVAIWANASQNAVGGLSAGQGNTIANNGAGGIRIESGDRNSILGNLIYDNANIGIDLNFDGVTLNDAIDADGGANLTQNFPILVGASRKGSGMAVRGTLNTAPSETFTVQYYSASTCDIALHGEGEVLLDTVSVNTDVRGAATLDQTIPASLTVGTSISAIATDSQGNSSEFGRCVQVIAEPTSSVGGVVSSESVGSAEFASVSPTLTVEIEGGGTQQVSADIDGRYWLVGLPIGRHNFIADSNSHLPARIANVTIDGGVFRLPDIQLVSGDLDDSNGIDIADIIILATSFGAPTSTRTDSSGRLVDFNGDGVVDILDVSALAGKVGLSGDQSWTGSIITPDPRYGAVLHTVDPTEQDELISRIGNAWFLDAGYDPILPALANKVMWVGSLDGLNASEPGPTPAELAEAANLHRGAAWLLANEPNRRAPYAVANVIDELHDSWEAIKLADPTALIISPPVLNFLFTCVGCEPFTMGQVWWDEFIAEYAVRYSEEPPIDIWAVNAYPLNLLALPTVDSLATVRQVIGFRSWLDSRLASRGKPIWVTEFGSQWGFNQRVFDAAGCVGRAAPGGTFQTDAVNQFLTEVYDWFEANATDQNIQRWFQYIAYQDTSTCNADSYTGPTLFDGPATNANLTAAGELYRNRIVGLK
ncbi:MAG: CSLREA domain-containing protein [Chloroflexi bacterium]|nr:CSLREA domain-containing protein [Chloroflexota bacterium]